MLRSLWTDEGGAVYAETAIVLLALALAAISGLSYFGDSVAAGVDSNVRSLARVQTPRLVE